MSIRQNQLNQAAKLSRFEGYLAQMDRDKSHVLRVTTEDVMPATVSYTRREVLNALACLRGEPAIDWAVSLPEGEQCRNVSFINNHQLWLVQLMHQRETIFGGYWRTRDKAQEAAWKLQERLGVRAYVATQCPQGHLLTKVNADLTKNGRVRCRECRRFQCRQYNLRTRNPKPSQERAMTRTGRRHDD